MLIFSHGGVGAVGGIGGPKMGYVEVARENHVKKKVEEGDFPFSLLISSKECNLFLIVLSPTSLCLIRVANCDHKLWKFQWGVMIRRRGSGEVTH